MVYSVLLRIHCLPLGVGVGRRFPPGGGGVDLDREQGLAEHGRSSLGSPFLVQIGPAGLEFCLLVRLLLLLILPLRSQKEITNCSHGRKKIAFDFPAKNSLELGLRNRLSLLGLLWTKDGE